MKRAQRQVEPEHVAKEKFMLQRKQETFRIQAKTENQALMLRGLDRCQLVIAEGHAGTGKTYLASVHAANQFLKGKAKKIVLLRPYISVGKTIGMLPGTIREKLEPLMRPMLDDLKMVLGAERFECMIKNEEIILEAVENVRGRSYKDSVVIVDEAQNCESDELKAMVTRLEESSQLIIIGDSYQHDLKKSVSGIEWLSKFVTDSQLFLPNCLDEEDEYVLTNQVLVVKFTVHDVVRSGLTKMFVKLFHNAN